MAWKAALERNTGPTALVFSDRIPHQARDAEQLANISRGAYVLKDRNARRCDCIMTAPRCRFRRRLGTASRGCGAAGVDAQCRCFSKRRSGLSRCRAAALGAQRVREAAAVDYWQNGRDGWPDHRTCSFGARPGGVLMNISVPPRRWSSRRPRPVPSNRPRENKSAWRIELQLTASPHRPLNSKRAV